MRMRAMGKSIFSTWAAMALFIAGMAQTAVAAEAVYFEGKADLCAIDTSGYSEGQKGNGIEYTNGTVQLFRITSDHELMIGWEVLTYDTKTLRTDRTISSFEAFFTPDAVAAGALIDNSKFVMQDPPVISGTYRGTGALKGVTVDYELTLNFLTADYCYDHPYCDTPGAACVYLHDMGAPPFSWNMTGYVSGWDEE